MSDKELAGRISVVTGGAMGIGKAIARTFAAAGAHVVVADLALEDGEATVGEIIGDGGSAEFVATDVASRTAWVSLGEHLRREHGGLDVLVSNAGLVNRQSIMGTVEADLRRTVDVNLVGPLLGLQQLAPVMRERGGGSMILISSTSGMMGHLDAGYSATKWGLRGLAKTAAIEFAGWGIRANSVHPGTIPTAAHANAPQGHAEAWRALVPLHRAGTPDEVAQAVLFLASDRSAYVTGTEIVVDGGLTNGGVSTARLHLLDRLSHEPDGARS
ncbi:SDR family NAD(P)-dependent oxidoreductase [Amycolatopsis pithecellobii]|uniref:SDR family oxidoreductase n=1 Tax=Amycolatopsis pithecellobii TaxID=664692 RepID=A0A6N7YMP2_9PSEU|nr:SDR family NAD(P)-dependent oxidoreductase [Amycolatopsis pithecellobii]MTD53138.1 SDR family oxidoreductase [Amycolatopsis pithecellobii]